MTREKSAGDIARENAPTPTEALGTIAAAVGTVKWWRDDKGWGVIATEQTAPFDVWCGFSAIEAFGYRSLKAGQRVEVEYERADQDSFKYRAIRAKALT